MDRVEMLPASRRSSLEMDLWVEMDLRVPFHSSVWTEYEKDVDFECIVSFNKIVQHFWNVIYL